MRIGVMKRVGSLVLVTVLCVGTIPAFASADDNDKSERPGKPAVAKVDAPAPLTERERWLLDRVEELEKRVADLESKGKPSESPAADPSAAQPGAVNAPTSVAAAATPSGALEPTPANSDALSNNRAAAVGPQATEKGKSGAARPGPAKPGKAEPFAFADFTWLNGNSRTKDTPYATSFFTPEIRADVDYNYSFNHPKDDTIGGSSEVFRHGEVQVTQLGVGGDFHYDNVRARLMTQFGLYSQTTPRNDASPARGQWNLDNAYRYISEAYGGYHFNALHGINVDAGIFMSYIGLFSYYQFDNWAYQPSYVSSNTPWFFTGVRVQIFPTEHLKI